MGTGRLTSYIAQARLSIAPGGSYASIYKNYYGPYGTFGMWAAGVSRATNVGPYPTAPMRGDPPAEPYVDNRRPLFLCTNK